MELHQLPKAVRESINLYCKAFNISVKSIEKANHGYFDKRDGSYMEARFRIYNLEHSADYKVMFHNGETVCF
jgi:hypothetical protein